MDQFLLEVTEALSRWRKAEEMFAGSGGAPGPMQAMRWSLAAAAERAFWGRVDAALARGGGEKRLAFNLEESCLFNFGATPAMVRTGLAWRASEEKDCTVVADAALPPELEQRYRRALGFMEMNYAESQSSTGVYNVLPWLRDMLRDSLDLDHREELQRRILSLQDEIKSLPERILRLGVPSELVTEVVMALRRFQGMRDQTMAREKNKSSVIRARDHAAASTRVEDALRKAGKFVSQVDLVEGKNPLEELYESWKEAHFSLAATEKEFAACPAEDADAPARYLDALRKTLARCAESVGEPQCSALDGAEAGEICPREVVEQELGALLSLDVVGSFDLQAERMETRRFGPLCAVIAPGRGVCRYSLELREMHAKELERAATGRRDYDLDRRSNYPLNYLVVPNLIRPEQALERMADAFLEYKSIAFSPAYRNALSETRKLFPEIYNAPDYLVPGGKDLLRKKLARYLAAFVRWARYGRLLDAEGMPVLEEFIAWARARLQRPQFLVPPRYKCILEDFAEATPERRLSIYGKHLRRRLEVDRAAFSLAALEGDYAKAASYAEYLPASMRENPYFLKALEPLADRSAWARQKVPGLFRRFILSEPVLKRDYLSFEAAFNAELDAVRALAVKKLGRELPLEQALQALAGKKWQEITQRRSEADADTDHDLAGLLFCTERNYLAAAAELELYLDLLEARGGASQLRRYDGSSLEQMLSGGGARGGHADDFVYYNLGSIRLRTGDLRGASDCFSRFCIWAAQKNWYLFGAYAREINEEIEARMSRDTVK